MDSIVIGAEPLITAFNDPIVIMTIKNSLIFLGLSTIFHKVTGFITPIILSIIPFALWNNGEVIKFVQSRA